MYIILVEKTDWIYWLNWLNWLNRRLKLNMLKTSGDYVGNGNQSSWLQCMHRTNRERRVLSAMPMLISSHTRSHNWTPNPTVISKGKIKVHGNVRDNREQHRITLTSVQLQTWTQSKISSKDFPKLSEYWLSDPNCYIRSLWQRFLLG